MSVIECANFDKNLWSNDDVWIRTEKTHYSNYLNTWLRRLKSTNAKIFQPFLPIFSFVFCFSDRRKEKNTRTNLIKFAKLKSRWIALQPTPSSHKAQPTNAKITTTLHEKLAKNVTETPHSPSNHRYCAPLLVVQRRTMGACTSFGGKADEIARISAETTTPSPSTARRFAWLWVWPADSKKIYYEK